MTKKMAKKLKIMHIIGSAKAGGAEMFYLRLVSSLSKRNDCEVMPVVRQNSWLAEQLQAQNIPHETAKFGGMLDFSTKNKLKTLIKQQKPDIIQTWLNRAGKFLPATDVGLSGEKKNDGQKSKINFSVLNRSRVSRFCNQNVSFWTKSDPEMTLNNKLGYARDLISNPVEKCKKIPTIGRMGGYYNLKYYKNCDYIVGNTPLICDYLIKQGIAKERVEYLPNFIPEPPADFQAQRQQIRAKYNIPDDAILLIMAGRLHHNKGIDIAINALEKLPQNIHLLLVGDGPLASELQGLVISKELMERVHFVGWQSNISPFAGAADIWLAPSRHEPLGNIVLDAWAHKLPVIAAAVDGPKLLINDTVNGLLFTSEASDELSDKIKLVTADEKLSQSLAISGYNTLQENFSEEIIIKKYLDFYYKIVL